MQVSIESTGALQRVMRVELPEDRVSVEVESRLESLSRTTRIQGFRPGKAPLRIVRQRFGQRVRQEVVGELVQRSFYEAIGKEKLRPASGPEISPLEANSGNGIRYTAKFEVLPDFDPAAPENLEVERTACEITEANIDTMVETLRKQHRTLNPVDRGARGGDVIEVNFTGRVDGGSFEGGDAREFRMELGAGRLLEGFEDGLKDRKAGDTFQLNLKFPDDYRVAALRGKPVTFDVSVLKVLESILPELDETFFATFGVRDGGAEGFRKEVREHMEREAAAVIRNRLRDSVIDAVYRANAISLPDILVEREKQRFSEQLRSSLKTRGITADIDKTLKPELFDAQARRRVTVQLVVGEIIRRQVLKPDPARVRALIESTSRSYEDPAAIVSWYYADRSRLAEMEAMVLEDEVIEWLAARARVREVRVPFDELVNKRQTESA
ncbi:MAG: trigger factor [Gammaproteobacteria bacterium]|nr:trigger factor [Gammaproteobacteria bacterium]